MSTITLLWTGWAAIAAVMTVLWLIQWLRRNAGIVDVAWSFGTALIGIYFAWGAAGLGARKTLVALMAGIWGARLGAHLLRRVLGEAEDGRYQALRARWGNSAGIKFFVFFQIQAVWAVMFAVPMLLAARSVRPALGWPDALGAAIWVLAITGEAIADWQLAAFRAGAGNRGKVCQVGLWRHSRHPNYFFEWLHWWTYVSIGFAAPFGWVTLFAPAVMLLFLFKVTGIPATEARAIESRGEAYREYQRTTSAFVPWPRRQAISRPGSARRREAK
jgi:steroid 5-alpha reductase family enzyme